MSLSFPQAHFPIPSWQSVLLAHRREHPLYRVAGTHNAASTAVFPSYRAEIWDLVITGRRGAEDGVAYVVLMHPTAMGVRARADRCAVGTM